MSASRRPNILILSTDQHRYDCIGYAKDYPVKTPNLDRLALEGMAFTNAFLGVNHSIAHKIGGMYHITHGRANAVLLPHVVEYNSKTPTKMVSWPKYKSFIADKKYAQIAMSCGFYSGNDTQKAVEALISEIKKLMRECDMPQSFKDCGIDEKEYTKNIHEIALRAFEDQCTTANPRLPLDEEIEEILKAAYK